MHMSKSTVRDLRAFGLSEWEARSYVALATSGSLTARALSAVSRIPISKIYDVLRGLRRKSLAAVRATRPLRWVAIEPAAVLKGMLEARRAATTTLEAKTVELTSRLRPAARPRCAEIWTATGRRAFLDKAAEIAAHARSELRVVTSKFTRTGAIDAAFKAAVERGISIRVLGTKEPDRCSASHVVWYSPGAAVRLLPLDVHPAIALVDDREVLVRVDSDEQSDWVWSNHPALVAITGNFFENLWARAAANQRKLGI